MVTNPVLELLNKGQDLIRDPAHWTKGYYARTSQGDQTRWESDEAVCFCSYGALYRAEGSVNAHLTAGDLLQRASNELDPENGYGLAHFNDTHTHEDVMRMWDRAKELAHANA